VMLSGELVEFLVRLQQCLNLGRLLIHAAPPLVYYVEP